MGFSDDQQGVSHENTDTTLFAISHRVTFECDLIDLFAQAQAQAPLIFFYFIYPDGVVDARKARSPLELKSPSNVTSWSRFTSNYMYMMAGS